MNGNIRKLASIQRIDDIKPIEGAEKIEIAIIGGWRIVVKKGEFKIGDFCVFCEIDSVFPEKPEFEFLRSKHFRIKTFKAQAYKDKERKELLFSVISQGIAFQLSILGEYILSDGDIKGIDKIKVGTDVTEILGIIKYEVPVSPQLMGMARGNFPTNLLPITDEERLQSRLKLLDEINDKICIVTLKEDGTSFTAYHVVEANLNPEIMDLEERVGVCSRHIDLKEEAFPGSTMNLYWEIANQYDVKNKLMDFYHDTGRNIAIQGEITGYGINGNKLGLPTNTHQLHLFNVYDIDEHKYVDYMEFIMIAKKLDIPTVKTVYFGKFNFTLEQLIEMSRGKYEGTENLKEGIVIRPVEEEFSEVLQGRLSFKVISPEYSLEND